MELVDRYLQAVGFWLPKAQRDDITAELAEDIRSQIEDKEAELGRKADDDEIEAVLKGRGHPLIVAEKYLPQQYFVGPVLYPIYRFMVKVFVWGYLLPWMLVWLGFIIFSPSFRSHDPIHKLGEMASTVLYPAFFYGTLAFAFSERFALKSLVKKDWRPRKLPAVRDPRRIRRSSAIWDLAATIILIVWWMSVMRFRTVFEINGATIRLSLQWRYYVGGYLLVSLAIVILSCVNLLLPYWTRLRASVRMACDCAGGILFCWLLKSAMLVEIILPNAPAAKSVALTNAINMTASAIFPIAVFFCVVLALVDLRRVFRVKTTNTALIP